MGPHQGSRSGCSPHSGVVPLCSAQEPPNRRPLVGAVPRGSAGTEPLGQPEQEWEGKVDVRSRRGRGGTEGVGHGWVSGGPPTRQVPATYLTLSSRFRSAFSKASSSLRSCLAARARRHFLPATAWSWADFWRSSSCLSWIAICHMVLLQTKGTFVYDGEGVGDLGPCPPWSVHSRGLGGPGHPVSTNTTEGQLLLLGALWACSCWRTRLPLHLRTISPCPA